MNLQQLHQLQPFLWSLPCKPGEKRAEVLLYGSAPLLASMDDKVLVHIANVASLPGLVGAAMTMPDAHWGYGFPIGGVAAFDAEQGGVISAEGSVLIFLAASAACVAISICRIPHPSFLSSQTNYSRQFLPGLVKKAT